MAKNPNEGESAGAKEADRDPNELTEDQLERVAGGVDTAQVLPVVVLAWDPVNKKEIVGDKR